MGRSHLVPELKLTRHPKTEDLRNSLVVHAIRIQHFHFLVRELRFHKPHNIARNKKTKKTKRYLINFLQLF